MPKPDIQTLILQRAVNALRAGHAAKVEQRDEGALAVCVDLQNLHYFLSSSCGIPASQVDPLGLVRAIAARCGLCVQRFHVFTGIHDQREATKMKAMERRLSWFRRGGAIVTAIPLAYSREGERWRAREKGVDVAIGAELVRLAHDGWRNVLVITQDRDLAAAASVAKSVAAGRLTLYSLRLEGDGIDWVGRCGTGGIDETNRIVITRADVVAHLRQPRVSEPACVEQH